MSEPSLLRSSLDQLNTITKGSYNAKIATVALNLWAKDLQPKNPIWQFVTAKSFSIDSPDGSAHVLAMHDKRLPDIGIVGYFACTGSSTGAEVLKQSADWLRQEYDIKDVYGPINGTLPNDYRLNLADDYKIPGEPVNPLWHIDAFKDAGFEVFNRYASGVSKINMLLMTLALQRPKKEYKHLNVRPFSLKDKEGDFQIYHELRNAIFPLQSVYCPAISLEERIYNSSGKFNPNYTYFLDDDGREVGFIMAYVHEGKLVMKTIGILPAYQGQGLSSLLLKRIHDQAKKEGLKESIYAMVRVGNRIYKSRIPGVKVFRKYVTMHKKV